MRLSCFGFVKDIEDISKAGFDCIEMHYSEIIPMSEGDFQSARQKLRDSPLTAEVINNPLPLDKRIASPEFDLNYYTEHLKKGAERAAELGARFCNFGNGRTRSLPDGDEVTIAQARSKILEAISICCEINAQYNITVLMEPLGTAVSNYILGISEALDLAKEINVYNLKPFVDVRWFAYENHPYEEIITYADQIQHIHIDNPSVPFPTRLIPRITDDFDYAPLMDALKKICYKGIISCEANTFTDFKTDLVDLLSFFKHFDIEPYRS